MRSPLNFLGSSFGSLTLELLVSATAWWVNGVVVELVTTVVLLSGTAVTVSWVGGDTLMVVTTASVVVVTTASLVVTGIVSVNAGTEVVVTVGETLCVDGGRFVLDFFTLIRCSTQNTTCCIHSLN